MRLFKYYGKKLIMKELKKSYNFFIKEANTNKSSKGYGLIRDKTIFANNIASIASVGYGLAALVIGVEHKWIKYKKAYERASKTLDTFLYNVEGQNGFYYHFINIENGKREWNCEISIIDTAIFICGAITAGEYFGVLWNIIYIPIFTRLDKFYEFKRRRRSKLVPELNKSYKSK